MTLDDILELDGLAVRVVRTPARHHAEIAPEVTTPEEVYLSTDGSLEILSSGAGDGWTFLAGHSGQEGYAGPVMHAAEQLDGALERAILERAGLYAAVTVRTYDDNDIAGWAVAYRPEAP